FHRVTKRPPGFREVHCGVGLGVLRYAVRAFLPASFEPPIRSSITIICRARDRIARTVAPVTGPAKSLVRPPALALDVEARGPGDGHDGHDPGLHRIADDEIR